MTAVDFYKHRKRFLTRIEECTTVSQLEALGFEDDETDTRQKTEFAASVPAQVRVFIRFVRCLFSGARTHQPESHFGQCVNKRCNRLFLLPQFPPTCKYADMHSNPIEIFDPPLSLITPTLDDANNVQSLKYWSDAGSTSFWCKHDDDTTRKFCSSACCVEYGRQMDRFFRLDECAFDATRSIRMSERPGRPIHSGCKRIRMELKHALLRNSKFLAVEKRKKPTSVSRRVIKDKVRDVARAMTVDAGVLYWASVVSQLPMSSKRVEDADLPGGSEGWRNGEQHAVLASIFSDWYEQCTGRHARLVTDLLCPDRFLSLIKSRATHPELASALAY